MREVRPRKLEQFALIGTCTFVESNKCVRRFAYSLSVIQR
jgi:hypothetical protein